MSILFDGTEEDFIKYRKELTAEEFLTKKEERSGKKPAIIRMWSVNEDKNITTIYVPLNWYRNLKSIKPESKEITFHKRRLKFKGELYDTQVKPADKVLKKLIEYGSVTVAFRTGFGKSMIGVWLSSKLIKQLVLVVYTFKVCEGQWYNEFKNNTNASIHISGKGNKYPEKGFHVILSSINKIKYIDKEILQNVGLLIIDEVHCFYTQKRLDNLFMINPSYIVAMSATPLKNKGLDRVLYSVVGEDIITSSNIPYEYLQINTEVKPEIKYRTYINNYTPDWNVVLDSLSSSEKRNELIANLCINAVEELERKVLVVTTRKLQNKFISKIITDSCKLTVETFDSKKKKIEDSDILIGTYGKLGTAFDEKSFLGDIERRIDCVILAFPIANINLLKQLIGRSFRCKDKTPLIIDLIDDNSITINQAKNRKKFYDSSGAISVDE